MTDLVQCCATPGLISKIVCHFLQYTRKHRKKSVVKQIRTATKAFLGYQVADIGTVHRLGERGDPVIRFARRLTRTRTSHGQCALLADLVDLWRQGSAYTYPWPRQRCVQVRGFTSACFKMNAVSTPANVTSVSTSMSLIY